MAWHLRAALRLALMIGWSLACIPLQAVLLALGHRLRERLPMAYHRVACRLMGIAVELHGAPTASRPTLFVVNHTSYFDIPVISSLAPVSFVSKAEVASWPVFGLFAKLQRTVFIDRRARNVKTHRDEMQSRLAAGDNLVLFPEGTSSDGNRILPFKSALFSVAEHAGADGSLTVQPVSLVYTRLNGMPLGRAWRHLYTWSGDMTLAGHMWRALGLGTVTVDVEFHKPTTAAEHGSRRALADHCRRIIAAGVSAALSGRRPASPERAPVPARA